MITDLSENLCNFAPFLLSYSFLSLEYKTIMDKESLFLFLFLVIPALTRKSWNEAFNVLLFTYFLCIYFFHFISNNQYMYLPIYLVNSLTIYRNAHTSTKFSLLSSAEWLRCGPSCLKDLFQFSLHFRFSVICLLLSRYDKKKVPIFLGLFCLNGEI